MSNVVSLGQIIQGGDKATREQLETLYTQYVCKEISSNAIGMMRDSDLRRYVSIRVYQVNKEGGFKNNRRLIGIVCQSIGICQASLYKWVK